MSEVTGNRQVVIQKQNGLTRYRLPSLPVWHGFFARTGGLSREPYATLNTAYVTPDPHAAANRERLLTALGIADAPVRILNPCHGEKIVFMEKRDWQTSSRAVLSKTDAAFTDTPDRYFLVSTGDCIPAIFTAASASFAGIVHLGWRNLVAALTGTVITALQARYKVAPAALVVGIGPAIGPCCYVFQQPLQQDDPFWQPFLQDRGHGNYGIDLIGAFKAQLLQRGVQEENIHETGLCTSCHNELFFSCYKEGYMSGRFPTVVGLARR